MYGDSRLQALAGICLLVGAGVWYIFIAMPERHREATLENMYSYGGAEPVEGGLFSTEDPEIVKRGNRPLEEREE